MKMPPKEVIDAARVVERWAAENNIKSWKVGALASRDELERTAARYAIARDLGTEVYVDVWRGIGKKRITGAAYDRYVDACVSERLSVGEIINLSSDLVA
jgi:hypothetical protein